MQNLQFSYWNVLQESYDCRSKPLWNHSTRCADEPWVKFS
jgi:hypothetical protein